MPKVMPGQPWRPQKAPEVNRTLAATDLSGRRSVNVDRGPSVGGNIPTAAVQIKNDCGEDRDRYDCLLISDHALDDPDQLQPMLVGDAVDSPADVVAILQEPIIDGSYGLAHCAGCCWAYVDIDSTSGLDHTRCIPAAADYQLQSAFSGPHRILWQPGTTGKQLCFVQLWAPQTPLYALTRGSGIPAATVSGTGESMTITPGSATCSLFYWDEVNGRWAILKRSGTAVDATIYNNWTAIVGEDAEAIIKVSCADDGKLTVDSEMCPTT